MSKLVQAIIFIETLLEIQIFFFFFFLFIIIKVHVWISNNLWFHFHTVDCSCYQNIPYHCHSTQQATLGNSSPVFNDPGDNSLLKLLKVYIQNLQNIVWGLEKKEIVTWNVSLGHKRTGLVLLSGAEVSYPNIFSIACTKMKWFCPNITWSFARKWLFEKF